MNILSLPSLCMHTYASFLKVHHTTYIVLQFAFHLISFYACKNDIINKKPHHIPLLSPYHCLVDIIWVFPDILLLLIMLQWTSIWVCILQSLCKYFQSITKVKGYCTFKILISIAKMLFYMTYWFNLSPTVCQRHPFSMSITEVKGYCTFKILTSIAKMLSILHDILI